MKEFSVKQGSGFTMSLFLLGGFFVAFIQLGPLKAQDTLAVLFLGNSYTSVNNLPQLVQALSASAGKTLIVDDSLPKVAGGTSGFVYTTYLFGTNAIAFGEDPMPMGAAGEQIAVEVDRDILAGQSYLTNRRHFIMHMKGVKWTGTIAGDTPADAELEAGASWARVFEKKNVPALALLTNG